MSASAEPVAWPSWIEVFKDTYSKTKQIRVLAFSDVCVLLGKKHTVQV